MFKKAIALLLMLTMVIAMTACSGKKNDTENTDGQASVDTEGQASDGEGAQTTSKYDTLVIGISEMNKVFNPLYYTSAYDADVMGQVFSAIMQLNGDNELTPFAGDISYEEITDETGEVKQVLYTVKMNEGITFSDGEPMTIDDLIFTYYVYADPMYDGMGTFSSLDIVGLNEYYYDTPDYSDKMAEIEEEAGKVSDEEVLKVIEADIDEAIAQNGAAEVNTSEELGIDEGAKDFDKKVKESLVDKIKKYDWDSYVSEAKDAKYNQLKEGYITGNLEDGIDVADITGIKKIDDYSCTVLFNGVDINAERQLGLMSILPEHYYSVGTDGSEFTKGFLAPTKSKNDAPLGSGPFIYEGFDNNIVTLTANPNYFQGAPKIPTLKFQVVSENNKVDSVIMGEIDISDPSSSKEIMIQLKENDIQYSLVDNNGYGYIAISSMRVPDANVRKGLMHLMNRKPAIESYYGELATIIERPMTTTLAEYPEGAEEVYGYDPAKAGEYFEKAGYSKDSSGKLVDKNGKQLSIEIVIGNLSTHPSAAILTQMKTDMDSLGAEFIISDVDTSILFDRMNKSDVDMWVAAWTNSNDCDITQMFHSSNAGVAGGNLTYLTDPKLDALLEETVKTVDLEDRKKLVAEELDIIMDWAVYMPVYQRKNLYIYNPEVINMKTIPETTSPYWTYKDVLYKVELN